jgi:hypothetical protein
MNSKEQTAKLRELRLAKEKQERDAARILKSARVAQKAVRVERVIAAIGESIRNGTFHENQLPSVLKALKRA